MAALRNILLLVLGWSQSLPLLCLGQCDKKQFLVCIVREVDMTSDGGSKLRRIIDDEEQYYAAITIEKLVFSGSASGPFLQRIGTYTTSILYERYRDAVFQLPPEAALSEIDIKGSGALRSFVAGQNSDLRKLFIRNCSLDRIPPTLGKLTNLQQLVITECLLPGLRMDALIENRQLYSVDLSKNKIHQLFPITASGSTAESAVEQLFLKENQIERLDMAAFAHFTQLIRLELGGNKIVQLAASTPVTVPNLIKITLASNKIVAVDLTNATLPRLGTLNMDMNSLPELPSHWGRLPSLVYLFLEQNKLKRMDLARLRPLKVLERMYVTNNLIESVRASAAVRMVELDMLEMGGNQINALNLTGCYFPNITIIGLSDNKLTTVPPVFQRFPKARLLMDGNPIKCSILKPLMNQLAEGRLIMTSSWESKPCATSAIVVNNYLRVCCDP